MSFPYGSRLHLTKTIIQGSNRSKNTFKKKERKFGGTAVIIRKRKKSKISPLSYFTFLEVR